MNKIDLNNSSNYKVERAATTMQKHMRGYLVRKAHLPQNLFPQYNLMCKKIMEGGSHSIPQALDGKTKVYLPQEIPRVVIKNSGRKSAIARFHLMQLIRSILIAQKSSHLIIPRANLCNDFLVEERLPINTNTYHNMNLYISQPELFDDAVRELTRLFSQASLGDLIDKCSTKPLGRIAGDFVRYDNLPLYITEENGKKVGKIGLIDLEEAHTTNSVNVSCFEIIARIFPYHVDIIKEETDKLNIDVDEKRLIGAAKRGQSFLQVGFTDHLKWLEERGISSQNALEPFELSPHRMTEIITVVEQELLHLNNGNNDLYELKKLDGEPEKHFLTENPEEMAKDLALKITPIIISNLKSKIDFHRSIKMENPSEKSYTNSELVDLRSPYFRRPDLYNGVDSLLRNNEKIKFENEIYSETDLIASKILDVVMGDLWDNDDIYYYDPAYYTKIKNLCWVRY